MKIAIVTYSDDKERYRKGQQRQQESLKAVGFTGDYYHFHSFEEIGSPTHEQVPYAFKPYAIQKVRAMGYDIVLWMDSPVYATKSLDTLFAAIESKRVLLFDNIGYSIGDYTSDQCLKLLGMGREESFNHPMIMACVMGFDFRSVKANAFFNSYFDWTKTKGAYEGDWFNYDQQVSTDKRVHGHRHDQSVASIVAVRMNVKPIIPHHSFLAYFGNAGHLPHAESVCLISAGF